MVHIVECDCSDLQSPGGLHYHVVTEHTVPIGADYVRDEAFLAGDIT